jgi:predicted DNA-binding protein YlxM (UPF0122 family)
MYYFFLDSWLEQYELYVVSSKSLVMEEWNSIPGYSDYEVSSLGNIRSKERTKVFKNGRTMNFENKLKMLRKHPINGFLMTDLIDDSGKRKTVYPHKAVALAFIPNSTPKKQKIVMHLDGNVQNNEVSNLKWSTHSESIRKGFELGKRDNSDLWLKRRLKYGPKGGNNSMGRPDPLDFAQKKRIHYLRNEKGFSLKQLAEKYNCSISHIHKTILRFKDSQTA